MFSKQHYKILAEFIGKAKDLEDFTDRLTNFLSNDNPNFDIVRFNNAIEKARQEVKHDTDKPNSDIIYHFEM